MYCKQSKINLYQSINQSSTQSDFITVLNIVGGRLRKLNMSFLRISLSEISFLTTTLQNPEDLDISRYNNITQTGLITLLDIFGGRLGKLNMSCLTIKLSDISYLTTILQNLENFDISG